MKAISVSRLALLILACGLAWRVVRYVMNFPIWGDEAFLALNFMIREGLADLLQGLTYTQVAPLGFVWLEMLISSHLGYAEWTLRLLPFLCGLIALFLFFRLAHKTLQPMEALFSLCFFAATYYLVRHGAEVKPYSLDLLLTVSLLYLAFRLLTDPTLKLHWVLMGLISVLGVWCSYPTVLVAGSVYTVLGWRLLGSGNTKFVRNWAIWALLLGVSFLSFYYLAIKPQMAEAARYYQAGNVMWNQGFPPLSQPWLIPWWLLKTHMGTMLAYPLGSKHGGSLLTFILVLAGITKLRKSPALLALLLAPALAGLAAAFLKLYPYGSTMRTMLYLAPSICLLAGVGLNACLQAVLGPDKLPKAAGWVCALFAAICLIGTAADVIKPYKHLDDYQHRAAYRQLEKMVKPQDRLMVFTEYGPLPADAFRSGGEGAVSRYYLGLSFPRLKGTWPLKKWPRNYYDLPPADSLSPGQKTWLLVFRNYGNSLNQIQLAQRLSWLKEHLGQPKRHIYKLELDRPTHNYLLAYEYN